MIEPHVAAYALRLYEKGYTIPALARIVGVSVEEMKAAIEAASVARS